MKIGFVSTRLAGTDGVSLEVAKLAEVFENHGHECFYFAGESDRAPDKTHVVETAHFTHPDIDRLNQSLFVDHARTSEISAQVEELRSHLKSSLAKFVREFDLDLLIPQNALSLPMNVPLGLALTDLIAEQSIATLAHHHDFHWEKVRFAASAAEDYLRAAFPPVLPSLHHVVINSIAMHQLALRTGQNSTLLPNVMDFEQPPGEPDEYAADLRAELSIPERSYLILQPTRIVPRKRIETAIEITARLGPDCTLLISHASGDEGIEYERYLHALADLLQVRVIFAAGRVDHARGQTESGDKIYSLADVYRQADLVTYPSSQEGFGNAFLEAVYFQKPILVNRYDVYRADIGPKGFRVLEFDGHVTDEVLGRARQILENPGSEAEGLAHNYATARKHYSHAVLARILERLLADLHDR